MLLVMVTGLKRWMGGMIDIVVCVTSFQFDCLLELNPFLALFVPVFDPDWQLYGNIIEKIC